MWDRYICTLPYYNGFSMVNVDAKKCRLKWIAVDQLADLEYADDILFFFFSFLYYLKSNALYLKKSPLEVEELYHRLM